MFDEELIPANEYVPAKPQASNPEELYITDTETCGLSGGVVEWAWLRMDWNLNVLETFCQRMNPEMPIHPEASKIHGIYDQDVADLPVIGHYSAKFRQEPKLFIGHNIAFDLRMLGPNVTSAGDMCTVDFSRQYIKGTTNHKLPTLKAELGLPHQESHTALGDILTVRDLLIQHILPLSGQDLRTLFARAQEPRLLPKMPYGKHKGKAIALVPKSYRDWLLAQSDIDKNLRFTLEKWNRV